MTMPAGRELDAKVSIAMGWPAPKLPDYWPGRGYKIDGWELITTNGGGMEWMPDTYSESWDAMRLVVKKMRELGWVPSFAQGFKGPEWMAFFEKPPTDGSLSQSFNAASSSLPHAVCLAALAAVESKKENSCPTK